MEACLELASEHGDWIVGLQDLGAAGLTSVGGRVRAQGRRRHRHRRRRACPAASRHDAVRGDALREPGAHARHRQAASTWTTSARLFDHWELHCDVIGAVTDGTTSCASAMAARRSPRARRRCSPTPPPYTPRGRAAGVAARRCNAVDLARRSRTLRTAERTATATLPARCSPAPNIASKRSVYRQYDHQVLTNTVVAPGRRRGGDPRSRARERGIALATDCNARYCYLDPYAGGAIAVAEAARNVVCTGARPLAVTDCLNFGNPEKPTSTTSSAGRPRHGRGLPRARQPGHQRQRQPLQRDAGRAIYPTPGDRHARPPRGRGPRRSAPPSSAPAARSGCSARRSSSPPRPSPVASTSKPSTSSSPASPQSTSKPSAACSSSSSASTTRASSFPPTTAPTAASPSPSPSARSSAAPGSKGLPNSAAASTPRSSARPRAGSSSASPRAAAGRLAGLAARARRARRPTRHHRRRRHLPPRPRRDHRLRHARALGVAVAVSDRVHLTGDDLHPHIAQRMLRRGVDLPSLEETMNDGWPASDAAGGTVARTLVFDYQRAWEGRFYQEQEVTV